MGRSNAAMLVCLVLLVAGADAAAVISDSVMTTQGSESVGTEASTVMDSEKITAVTNATVLPETTSSLPDSDASVRSVTAREHHVYLEVTAEATTPGYPDTTLTFTDTLGYSDTTVKTETTTTTFSRETTVSLDTTAAQDTTVSQDTTASQVVSEATTELPEDTATEDGYHDAGTVLSTTEDNTLLEETNATTRDSLSTRRDRQMRPGRKSGQPCTAEIPCDEEFGLTCMQGVCSGPLSVQVLDITSDSARVSWGPPGFQPRGAISYANVFRGANTHWTTVKGVPSGLTLDGLLPDQEYFVKVEQDGKEEVVAFKTKSVMTPMPKILVKQRSPSTMTVVWDDFRLPSYHSEYVLEYRPATHSDQPWTKVKAGTQNIVTLSNLEPNTGYELKVAVWEDEKLELPSEVITAYTADGCVRGGTVYRVGEEYFPDCDFRCKCVSGNASECEPRCVSPYVRIGSKTDDPLCYEKPHPSDTCCVIIRCTESRAIEDMDEVRNKSGECPVPVGDESESDESCLSDCDHDRDCSGPLKCCPSACGGAVCVQPVPSEDVCEHVYCGPNAVCVSSQRACLCAEGFTGDPHDVLKGCSPLNLTSTSEEVAPVNGTFELDLRPKEGEEAVNTDAPPTESSDPASGNELEQEDSTTTTPFELDLREAGKSAEKDASTLINEHRGTENKTMDTSEIPPPHLFDGCEFNNRTYEKGASFDQGCEARCRCEGSGHVSCGSRCPPRAADGGPLCREVPDPDDPCCRIMLCSFPDSNNMEEVDGLPLKIISALAVNGSTIRIRVRLQAPPPPSGRGLEAWFREGGDNALPPWSRRRLSLRHLRQVGSEEFEFELVGLMPQTEYFVRVTMDGMDFSNTVSVKTFPAAVRNVVDGCVHQNRTFAAGEVFHVGCEHKCVCRAGGAVECQDRCPLYIDHVGYEGCEWVPAEEDPLCCKVPLCTTRRIPSMLVPHAPGVGLLPGGVPPSVHDQSTLCVVSEREVYRIGDIWETGDGCKLRVCRCAQAQDGTAQLQCHSQCPPPRPPPGCARPVLMRPEGPCSCPYLSCGEDRREERPPVRGPVMEAARHCEFKGRPYGPGEEFYDGCSALCHCGASDLRVSCAAIECPHHFSAELSGCLEWSIDPDFFPEPPQCCAPAVCVNNGSCNFAGRHFENFDNIPSSLLPCGALCICVNGNVTCESRCPEAPPQDLPCPTEIAVKAEPRPGDDCCPRWICPPHDNAHMLAGEVCKHEGRTYAVSERWESTTGQSCMCREGSRVECCPKVPARFLSPNEQCHRPVLVTPEDPKVCPYVVCNNSMSGHDLYNVQIVPLNSTAVRIRFSLAPVLVGLQGHAELRYTEDLTLPETAWVLNRFSRPARLLDTAHIEYVVGGLKAGVTYHMRLLIKVDALQGGPQSKLFKVRMPEDETLKTTTTTTTTTTSTTTTTIPPHIVVDTKLQAQTVDARTVKITWKSLDSQEKRYIDGLLLRYRPKGAGTMEQTTPLIHRDVTSYSLRDLRPASEYTIQMEFVSLKGLPTHIESAHSLQFQTPVEHKEEKKKDSDQEYELKVSAPENEVGVGTAHLSFTGVPAGRVHVARVMYKPAGDKGDMAYAFEVPKGSLISLESLKPGKKYMAKLELYLTNGQTLTSNEVEFITKPLKNNASKATDKQHSDNGKMAEPLQAESSGGMDEPHPYFIALIVVAVVAAVASLGFILLLVVLVRRQHHSAKAPISRTPSESAYDNPTYKTYDGEREEKPAVQTTQT